ncbi:hypothetical protein BCR36DRAFT_19792 [Piromyces finnis]|uniref:Uncharacterized protein n=1 Tax=Piromyces finnis TaxID=1754191 RepID=A0A1Y1VES1_9FUNG|nr:hypothetical protein BCR36DRAFT_19792 [Piromyces finnis]|eukprot:ORX53723.1 hypothetical protein BCR36DRAFT_19792 [Piromyces finnis]
MSITINEGDDRDYSNNYGMSSWERAICIFLMIFSTIYFNVVNFLLIRKRDNYIIKHRGILLTIPSSLASYFIVMNILFNEVIYTMEFHNVYIWINNILIVFVLMR